MKRICFDLDETLCTGYPYEVAKPFDDAAEILQMLKEKGYTIIIQTARGMGRSSGNIGLAVNEIALLTLSQLKEWQFVYDEIYFGKPSADIYVDDKSCSSLKELVEVLHATNSN